MQPQPTSPPRSRAAAVALLALLVGAGGGVLVGRQLNDDPKASRSIYDVDFTNRQYTCGSTTVDLVDGSWQADPNDPTLGTVEGFRVDYADVTGDGEREALVSFACTIGIGTAGSQTEAFTMTEGTVAALGVMPGNDPTPDDWAGSGTHLVMTVPDPLPSDPRCCPSQEDAVTYTYRDGLLVETERRVETITG